MADQGPTASGLSTAPAQSQPQRHLGSRLSSPAQVLPSPFPDKIPSVSAAREAAVEQLCVNNARMSRDRKYSDFLIKCGDQEWPVHKVIVCPHSKFFEAICDGGFKVSGVLCRVSDSADTQQESQQGPVTLEEDLPNVVGCAIRFMYMGNYHDAVVEDEVGYQPLLLNIGFHTFADKYDIPKLAQLALAKFDELACSCTDWTLLAAAVRETYTQAPDSKREMRSILAAVCTGLAELLFCTDTNNGEWKNKEYAELQKVAKSIPEFTLDVMARLATEKAQRAWWEQDLKAHTCADCGQETFYDSCPNCSSVW